VILDPLNQLNEAKRRTEAAFLAPYRENHRIGCFTITVNADNHGQYIFERWNILDRSVELAIDCDISQNNPIVNVINGRHPCPNVVNGQRITIFLRKPLRDDAEFHGQPIQTPISFLEAFSGNGKLIGYTELPPFGNISELKVDEREDMFQGTALQWAAVSTRHAESMMGMFLAAASLNSPLYIDASNATAMSFFLSGAEAFNSQLNIRNSGQVTNFSHFLYSAENFNHPIAHIDFLGGTNFAAFIKDAYAYNQDLSNINIEHARVRICNEFATGSPLEDHWFTTDYPQKIPFTSEEYSACHNDNYDSDAFHNN